MSEEKVTSYEDFFVSGDMEGVQSPSVSPTKLTNTPRTTAPNKQDKQEKFDLKSFLTKLPDNKESGKEPYPDDYFIVNPIKEGSGSLYVEGSRLTPLLWAALKLQPKVRFDGDHADPKHRCIDCNPTWVYVLECIECNLSLTACKHRPGNYTAEQVYQAMLLKEKEDRARARVAAKDNGANQVPTG